MNPSEAAEVERLTAEADRLAEQSHQLDQAGRCAEARQLERQALETAMRATLTAMGIEYRTPLPEAAVDLLDEATSDLVMGNHGSAAVRRNRALAAIAADWGTEPE